VNKRCRVSLEECGKELPIDSQAIRSSGHCRLSNTVIVSNFAPDLCIA